MIFDLHCDLLSYLASHPYRMAYDPECRASIPQLIEGKVQLQTMAVFTMTGPSSLRKGLAQFRAYKNLSERYTGYFEPFSKTTNASIQTCLAIENMYISHPAYAGCILKCIIACNDDLIGPVTINIAYQRRLIYRHLICSRCIIYFLYRETARLYLVLAGAGTA